MQHFELIGRRRLRRIECAQAQCQSETGGARREQLAIAEDHGAARRALRRQGETDIRADAGRLARGYGDEGSGRVP